MRLALVCDMEGTSHIDDIREPFPMYRAYWRSGREKLTNDVVAAARGLLDGGATEIVILDHHGAGTPEWPNLIAERLPDHVRLAADLDTSNLREQVDAMFEVGCHARGGSPSFLSHTILPGLRLRLRGELLSESHEWAWSASVPLLGIVGSAELGADLGGDGGTLGEVPYLAVQRSSSRRSAQAVFDRPEDTAAAIRTFAAAAARRAGAARTVTPRGPILLEAAVQNGEQAAQAMIKAGWLRTGPTAFQIEAGAWRDEADTVSTAIWAAADAAFVPYTFWFEGLDPTSEEAALAFPPDRLARADAMLESWASDATTDWITPDAATRWEGMESGQG
jgi:D-aminopeptidase